MADLSSLRARVRERAAEITEAAAASIEEQLRAAAGDGLDQSLLTRDPATVDEQAATSTVRLDTTGVTVWEWVLGEPRQPFDPHVQLAGVTFDESNWREVLAKDPAELPVGASWYYPGDHDGCQCTADPVVGDLIFDPFSLDAEPQVVSAFGVDVLVVPPAPGSTGEAPAWWQEILTLENWQQALRDATG